MKRLLFILLYLSPTVVYCQVDRLALFSNERTMDRRFTLYKGQLRTTGTYDLTVFKYEYDNGGNKTLLSENGISANKHSFNARVRYGIIDYLDIEYSLIYKLQNYRGEPLYIVAPPAPTLQVYTNTITKGFNDMYLGLNGRIPIPSKKLDIGGSFGLFLPTAKSTPDQPEHTFTTDELGDVINLYYLENWGYGVSSMYYQGFIKYRFENVALSFSFKRKVPMGESEGVEWSSQMDSNNNFIYTSQTFQYQNPQTTFINALIEYQLYQWVNVFFEYNTSSSINGWKQASDIKIAIPDAKLSVLSPGFEVLVSSKLWLRQKVSFPINGENSYSQFSIQTSFFYNLFISK